MPNSTSGNSPNQASSSLTLEQQIKVAQFSFWAVLLLCCGLIFWSALEADSFANWLKKAAFGIAFSVYAVGGLRALYHKLLHTQQIRSTYNFEEQAPLEKQAKRALLQNIRTLAWRSWILLIVLQAGDAFMTHEWTPVLFNSLFYGAFFVLPLRRVAESSDENSVRNSE